MGRRSIPDVVLKNEDSMVQTCGSINVHVVNTVISEDLLQCLWIAEESRLFNVHSIREKWFTKQDSRNTKVSIFLRKYFFLVPK